jgi:hypothetical protein
MPRCLVHWIPGPLPLRVAWTIECDVVAPCRSGLLGQLNAMSWHQESARHFTALNNILLCDNRTATYHCAFHINPHALAAQVQFAVLGDEYFVKLVGSRRWSLAALCDFTRDHCQRCNPTAGRTTEDMADECGVVRVGCVAVDPPAVWQYMQIILRCARPDLEFSIMASTQQLSMSRADLDCRGFLAMTFWKVPPAVLTQITSLSL